MTDPTKSLEIPKKPRYGLRTIAVSAGGIVVQFVAYALGFSPAWASIFVVIGLTTIMVLVVSGFLLFVVRPTCSRGVFIVLLLAALIPTIWFSALFGTVWAQYVMIKRDYGPVVIGDTYTATAERTLIQIRLQQHREGTVEDIVDETPGEQMHISFTAASISVGKTWLAFAWFGMFISAAAFASLFWNAASSLTRRPSDASTTAQPSQ